MAVHHHVDADRDQARDQPQRHHSQGRAGTGEAVLLGFLLVCGLLLASQLPQDQHDPEHRGEQDELLPERVEPADVEVERRHQVGGVALGDADPVDDLTVDAVVVAKIG